MSVPSSFASHIDIRPNMSQDDIVRSLIPIVKRTAARMSRGAPTRVSNDELVSAGMLGLIEATKRFDPSRAEKFVGFATMRIRGAMLDELRRIDPLSQDDRAKSREVESAVRALQNELGRAPEASEIAERLGVDEETYVTKLEELRNARVIMFDPEDETYERMTAQGLNPQDASQLRQLETQIADAIALLPEREQYVMALYYDKELTFAEIGEVLGVSTVRVCQIHGQAVHRIRATLAPFDSDARDAFESVERSRTKKSA